MSPHLCQGCQALQGAKRIEPPFEVIGANQVTLGEGAGQLDESKRESLEARVGFEPTNGGFADLSLGPLGYRAKLFSIAKTRTSVRALPGAPNSLRSSFASAFKSSCKQDAQICFFYSISCRIKSFKSWRILRFPAALS